MADNSEIELAGQAWDKATNGITGIDEIIAAFRPRFAEAVTKRTVPVVEEDFVDQLAVATWQWPWFDRWYKTFNEWRMWPGAWPALRPADDGIDYSPEDLAEFRKAAIASIIVATAAMIFFRDRHMSKAHMYQKWRLAFRGDAAEMKAAEGFKDKIAAGDLTDMPPYFPGDRTRLQGETPLGAEDDKRPEGEVPADGAPPAADEKPA